MNEPTTLATLAELMKQGFENLSQRIDGVATDLGNFKAETRSSFRNLDTRIFPSPADFQNLEARVSYIEGKLNIESGK